MAESGGGPQWRSSQQCESSHAPNHFKTDHFPIHPPDSQAAWLPQADVLNCKWSFCSYVPLRLASTHNRCPWSRHLKGLCHTLALYPDQCVTLLVTEAKGWNHWNLQLFQWFSTWADSANKGRHQKIKWIRNFLIRKKWDFIIFLQTRGGLTWDIPDICHRDHSRRLSNCWAWYGLYRWYICSGPGPKHFWSVV